MSSGLYNTHKIDFDTTLDLTRLKPYGDTMNDGKVQTSFTLPVKDDERGEEAARQIAKKMGLEEPNVAYHTALDKEFTFYVVYGSCVHSVNYEDIHVITVESDVMSMEDTNDYIREHIGRKVVMVGASTGTDAHTVGIDAIMNRKGFAGHYGLERAAVSRFHDFACQRGCGCFAVCACDCRNRAGCQAVRQLHLADDLDSCLLRRRNKGQVAGDTGAQYNQILRAGNLIGVCARVKHDALPLQCQHIGRNFLSFFHILQCNPRTQSVQQLCRRNAASCHAAD